MNMVIASDHRGFLLKEHIKEKINRDIQWLDVGAFARDRSDYPQFGIAALQKIQQKKAEFGVLLCGTGIGMSILANRYKGIYAGLIWNAAVAREAKEDDNVNVLVLPADYITKEQAIETILIWKTAQFKGGLYKERLDRIDSMI